MDDKLLTKLSQNFLEILNDNEYYDITIEVGNDSYVKIFRAHIVILNYRSLYLKRILSTNKKNNETLVHIKLSNILPEIFQIILRYIYGGKISLEEYDTSDIIKVLLAARELGLQELIPHLQSYLVQKKSTWMEQNFGLVYQMSFEDDSFLELQEFCTELISKEPEKIFKSTDFTSISEKSLISLIQNNNNRISEVQIWENVLKWGYAKNPELSSDNLASFSKDDFNTLKNTLQQCIPFIEFYNLTPKEFSDKVVPYKKILPKELYKNLLKDFLDNNDYKLIDKLSRNIRNIDSQIITYQHAELISKWIDKLEITDGVKNSYEFKLIFRGSRDGFTPEIFHKICDNQSHTVTIIKVKNSNEILGGYNPIKWSAVMLARSFYDFYGKTRDSFIFSFKNQESIKDYILSRVKDENYAICYFYDNGPSFGQGDLNLIGDNLYENSSYCEKNSYEKMIRETKDGFSVEEYEIFQIIKD